MNSRRRYLLAPRSSSATITKDLSSGSYSIFETVIDFYYVRPAIEAARRAALDRKLAEAGKPPPK